MRFFFRRYQPLGPETVVVTSHQVLDGEAPILFAAHMYSGNWQFMDVSDKTDDDLVAIHYSDIVQLDQSVSEISDLGRGYMAWREPGGEWRSRRFWSDDRIME